MTPVDEDDWKAPVWVRVIERLSEVAAWTAATAMIVLCASVLLDVAGRTFWNSPVTGTLEHVAYWWMPMTISLGLAVAHRHGEHVRVTLLVEALGPTHQRVLDVMAGIVVVVVVGYMTYFVIEDAQRAYEIKQFGGAAVPVSIWPIKIVIAIAMVVFTLQAIAIVYRAIRRPRTVAGGIAIPEEAL